MGRNTPVFERSVDEAAGAAGADHMPVAQNALKLLRLDQGGRAMSSAKLDAHLPVDLAESTARFSALASAT